MAAPLKILILEDNALDAELEVSLLKKAGYTCQWERVETRDEFVTRLRGDYDLILADYRLPQFDGLTALTLVRAQGIDIPFILVSGILGEEIAGESQDLIQEKPALRLLSEAASGLPVVYMDRAKLKVILQN